MYVCMYVCMYVWMDGWMYICMYVCTSQALGSTYRWHGVLCNSWMHWIMLQALISIHNRIGRSKERSYRRSSDRITSHHITWQYNTYSIDILAVHCSIVPFTRCSMCLASILVEELITRENRACIQPQTYNFTHQWMDGWMNGWIKQKDTPSAFSLSLPL